ncbi:MAG: YkvA family protein [Rhodanobacteraceae bacterium]
MPMDINIQLSDDDLQFFVKGMRDVEASVNDTPADQIIAAAQKLLNETRGTSVPPFIAERLGSVESMISMAKDVGFGLPDADRQRVLAALAYLADPNDAIPDSVPVLGFLDDAIMIELCRQDLRFEIEAYDDFCEWRADEARARGEDPAKLLVQRADWADARAAETIARMHRRRHDSYASGSWKPTLFKVG